MDVIQTRIKPYAIGRARLAIPFLIISILSFFAVYFYGPDLDNTISRGLLTYLIPAVVIFVAIHAYYNNGIVICWFLAFFPFFGDLLQTIGMGFTHPPTSAEIHMHAIIGGVEAAFIFGTIAFILGAGLHRLLIRLRKNG